MTFEANAMLYHNPRKSQRVYRSPSSLDEPSSYVKTNQDTTMEIDAKDEEAGTILMALSQHAARMRYSSTHDDGKPVAAASIITGRSNSMSIRNLLDNETLAEKPSSTHPYQSVSTGYRPYYESRRKGFQVCLTQRNTTVSTDEDLDHHRRKQRSFSRYPVNHTHPVLKIKGNTAHVHISYRIHAQQASLFETTRRKSTKTVHHSSYHSVLDHHSPYRV